MNIENIIKTTFNASRDPEVLRVNALCDETLSTIETVLMTDGPLSTDIRKRILQTISTSLSAYKATNEGKVTMQNRLFIIEALKGTYLGALNEARAERDQLRAELEAIKGTNITPEKP